MSSIIARVAGGSSRVARLKDVEYAVITWAAAVWAVSE
jgi:hypothetical protein